MRIAIDGYSSCGKSTLARALAQSLGYLYIDTGAMYRAVTWHLMRSAIPLDDLPRIEAELEKLSISFDRQGERPATLLNGESVETVIRQLSVSERVSAVAALGPVRRKLVRMQRDLAWAGSAVLDGRDIGTVVFPKAPLKIFLVADFETRVERRWRELLERDPDTDRELVGRNLRDRDHADTHRRDSPLTQAADAVVVDNTNLSPDEQLAMCLALARERLKKITE